MSELICENAEWRVERQPGSVTDPMVVRFVKQGRIRKLLDQNARWTPDGWDQARWVPRPPIVPAALIAQVAAFMRTHAADIARREGLRQWSQQRLADRQQEAGQ